MVKHKHGKHSRYKARASKYRISPMERKRRELQSQLDQKGRPPIVEDRSSENIIVSGKIIYPNPFTIIARWLTKIFNTFSRK